MKFKMSNAGLIPLDVNVEVVHLDRFGNVKQLFTENSLGRWILQQIRLLVPNPIDESGQVKPGLMNYLAAYGVRIPFVTGMWSNSMFNSNLITDAGRAAVASRINGSGGEPLFDKIGQGIGTTAAAVGDTALQTEKDATGATSTIHAVSAATATRVTTTVTNDTSQLVGTISESGTMAITESGLFNLATAGVMLARQVFSAINVAPGDSLQFTWKIKAA